MSGAVVYIKRKATPDGEGGLLIGSTYWGMSRVVRWWRGLYEITCPDGYVTSFTGSKEDAVEYAARLVDQRAMRRIYHHAMH